MKKGRSCTFIIRKFLHFFFRIRLSADCAITKAVADMYPDNFVQDLEMLL